MAKNITRNRRQREDAYRIVAEAARNQLVRLTDRIEIERLEAALKVLG